MYHSKTSFIPTIAPERYVSAEAHAEDCDQLRRRSWHLVGTTGSISRAGDYLATTVLDIPVLVRNCDGQLVAFRNVCAHRHCKLFDDGVGASELFKCRYHGWQYGSDGRTRRLPNSKQFPGFDREKHCLESFDVACCGQLVFVRLDRTCPELRDWLGGFFDEFQNGTQSDRWIENLSESMGYEANWKIPVEGSLESYHLDEVHAKTFGHDPGEDASEHFFFRNGSRFETRARGNSLTERLEEWSIRWMTGSFDGVYRHVHVYPNLMASFTEPISLVYQVAPVTPESCRISVFGFGRAATNSGLLRKMWARGLRRAAARVSMNVLAEDAAIFPLLQSGKRGAGSRASADHGVLGRCEERINSFHRFLTEADA